MEESIKKKKVNHYVNNKEFLLALQERKAEKDARDVQGLAKPKVTEYLGKVFLLIAENVARKHNFSRYPFKDEMIADGIMDCLRYVDSFDTTRSNPFAYYTQAVNNAFIRRIIREKKQLYIKSQLLYNTGVDSHSLQENDDDKEFANSYRDYMSQYDSFDGTAFKKNVRPKQTKAYLGATLDIL